MTSNTLIKWTLGLAALAAVGGIFYWSSDNAMDEQAPSTVAGSEAKLQQTPQPMVIAPKKASSAGQNDASLSFAQCQRIIQKLQVEQENWRQNSIASWSGFLEQGYSLDEVTLAVEHFQNSNFAAIFRIKQLRKDAALTRFNTRLQDKLYERAPKLAGKGLTISRPVPQPELTHFPELTAAEKHQVINQIDVTVDDVAATIILPSYTDDDIIQLIDAVDDVRATVGYQQLDAATSLLDFAAASGRLQVFNRLVDAGLSPTHDAYLGSTMEWALNGLMKCCERRQQRAEIVKQLIQLGAQARFSERSPDHVSGGFPRFFYEFNRADIEALRQDYGLNILSIKPRQPLQLERNRGLIDKLSKQRDQFIAENSDMIDVAGTREACQTTLEAVTQQWQPSKHQDVIKAFHDGSNKLSQAVASQLAQIDPALVDSYRQLFKPREQRVLYTDLITSISQGLVDGDIDQTLTEIEQASLEIPYQRFLIEQILAYDLSFYQPLLSSSLMDVGLQHQQLDSLGLTIDTVSKLAVAGYDIDRYDYYGKTLIYYAAQADNSELVKWLFERGVPYSADELGADPLYVALKHMGSTGNMRVISELMDMNPSITQFHRQRVAVVKLKYPQRYKQLIAKFPAFTVTEQTELPAVW